jgi:hypothetical protein
MRESQPQAESVWEGRFLEAPRRDTAYPLASPRAASTRLQIEWPPDLAACPGRRRFQAEGSFLYIDRDGASVTQIREGRTLPAGVRGDAGEAPPGQGRVRPLGHGSAFGRCVADPANAGQPEARSLGVVLCLLTSSPTRPQ